MCNVRIVSSGVYFPEKIVKDDVFDKRFNLPSGTTLRKSGVHIRHYVTENDTQIGMGVKAIKNALNGLTEKDIDCIIFAGGIPSQPIPCSASLIQRELGWGNSGIPCFDINSTCLSFVTALDTVSYLVEAGKYNRVLIVSSDIASLGLNYEHYESSILFGDAAAAMVIEKTPETCSSKILAYNLKTFGEAAEHASIKGGGSLMHAKYYSEETKDDYCFHMDGLKIYEAASKRLSPIFYETLESCNLTLEDIKLVIPHQASLMSMKLVQKKLRIPTEKFLYNIENTGNTIASSIPSCIDYVIKNKIIERGDKVALLGTSAGLSIGVMIFEY